VDLGQSDSNGFDQINMAANHDEVSLMTGATLENPTKRTHIGF
jgi:hypothetical protein